MATSARYRALQWFLDHEESGPDEVFNRKPPTTRMRRLMAKDGEVIRLPIGQFGYQKWILTPLGREVLQTKPTRRRRSLPRIHADKTKETGT
jgi:hypothetical protein